MFPEEALAMTGEALAMAGKKIEVPAVTIDKVSRNNIDVKETVVSVTEKQASFAIWLATPDSARTPSTHRELADVLGVSEMTLWRWAKRPDVLMAARYLILQNKADTSRIGVILDMFYEVAADTSVDVRQRLQAGEKYLDAVGLKYVWDGAGPELLSGADSVRDVENIPTEDLERMLMERNAGAEAGDDPDQ